MIILLASSRAMEQKPEDNLKTPVLFNRAQELLSVIKEKSKADMKEIWKCSDKNLDSYYQELQNLFLDGNLTMAIKSYKGVVYRQFQDLLDNKEVFSYLDEHLRIISALYGVLKASDGICPYRLEMAAPLKINGANLYRFWNYLIYEECRSDFIINLSSEEYGKCIRDYLNEDDIMIDIDFLQESEKGLKRISTKMKEARGQMLRYLALNRIESIEEIQGFDYDGYIYNDELSSDHKLVFIKHY